MKGETLPIMLMLHLVVPWLCLASSAPLPPALGSEYSNEVVLKDYIQVNFSTASANPEKYGSFIASVRAGLVSKTKEKSNGIPVLLSEKDPLAPQTYILITLLNKAGHSITLKMDVTRAYFTAYTAGNYSCLLKRSGSEVSATCWVNPYGMLQEPSSRYSYLAGDEAGDDLEAGAWRVKDLDEAISSIFLFPTGEATKEELGRGIATCNMMIASAAMSPYIERRISTGMWNGNGVADDPSLHALQARWQALSAAIQESFQGAFAAPVSVQRSNGKLLQVDNVRRVAPFLAFLHHYICVKPQQQEEEESPSSPSSQLPTLIRSVVEPEPEMGGAPAPACSQAEPTMRIVGPEGRCVDVRHGLYYNGNQVQLWSCKSYDDVNQLWTFKRDGTIRSNGMCLTSKGSAAGDYVVIYDCPSTPTDRVVWEVRADGTIALSRSGGLVLSASSTILPFLPTGLTVRADDRGTGQSWIPTNDTATFFATIVGFRGLCLQVDGAGAVTAATCRDGVELALYPDGSVRPPASFFQPLREWGCLAPDASGRVVVSYCNPAGSARQRWVFRGDGTVVNAGTGRVMDMRRSASKGAWEIVTSPATAGSPTQNWAIMM